MQQSELHHSYITPLHTHIVPGVGNKFKIWQINDGKELDEVIARICLLAYLEYACGEYQKDALTNSNFLNVAGLVHHIYYVRSQLSSNVFLAV